MGMYLWHTCIWSLRPHTSINVKLASIHSLIRRHQQVAISVLCRSESVVWVVFFTAVESVFKCVCVCVGAIVLKMHNSAFSWIDRRRRRQIKPIAWISCAEAVSRYTQYVVRVSHRLSFTRSLYKGHSSTDSVVIIACCDGGGFRIGTRGDWTSWPPPPRVTVLPFCAYAQAQRPLSSDILFTPETQDGSCECLGPIANWGCK